MSERLNELLAAMRSSPTNPVKCLTSAQVRMLKRYLHFVGSELLQIAASEKLPDQWGELNLSSYTIEAQAAVYNLMAADGMLPKRG